MAEITVKDFENKTLPEICALLDGTKMPKDIYIYRKKQKER